VPASRVKAVIDWSKRAPARLQALLEEYGWTAMVTYFAIFALVLGGFAIAIQQGVQVKSVEGNAGVLFGAWAATKLTQPFRIAATLVLTPFIARLLKKTSVGAQKSADPEA
jgi:hypothetical protein